MTSRNDSGVISSHDWGAAITRVGDDDVEATELRDAVVDGFAPAVIDPTDRINYAELDSAT